MTHAEVLAQYLRPGRRARSRRVLPRRHPSSRIDSVHLTDAGALAPALLARDVASAWRRLRQRRLDAAEIYPRPNNEMLRLQPKQVEALRLFVRD